MDDKEQMRRKFEACFHRGETYTERDFQMWCAGRAQGFVEGTAAGSLLVSGGSQSPSLPPGRVTWVSEPFAIVIDRLYDGAGLEIAIFDGDESYVFADGDCYQREGESMLSNGNTAEFLTHHQFQERFIKSYRSAHDRQRDA
ncbi:hypothetical protein PEP31012_03695 [Pandoraea eparura]|uniref:Uncharacterized protein n=1 Tax=Pandoraea eparura TaxID=2508291 RepID=A0A5E4X587_9BURK|nr:hypothetical protein [Pandoraea eparura]VVE31388.1 hypothetical protein PEP31012_03695 [Pandoraea eparura]